MEIALEDDNTKSSCFIICFFNAVWNIVCFTGKIQRWCHHKWTTGGFIWQIDLCPSQKGKPFSLQGLLITFQLLCGVQPFKLCLGNLVLPRFLNLETYYSFLETEIFHLEILLIKQTREWCQVSLLLCMLNCKN